MNRVWSGVCTDVYSVLPPCGHSTDRMWQNVFQLSDSREKKTQEDWSPNSFVPQNHPLVDEQYSKLSISSVDMAARVGVNLHTLTMDGVFIDSLTCLMCF